MLKNRSAEQALRKVKTYNPAEEVSKLNRSPEDIPEIERRFKPPKRPRRSLSTQSPADENKRAKVELDEVLVDGDKDVEDDQEIEVPVLTKDEDCQRIITEGKCNPRIWAAKHVEQFFVANELNHVAKKLAPLKMDGTTLLKQNRQTLGIQLDFRVVLPVMKFITMLRQIDHSYQEKQIPSAVEIPVPEIVSPVEDMPALRLRVGDETYNQILAKRKKYILDPEAYAKEFGQEKLNTRRFPGIGPTTPGHGHGGGRPKKCYKCHGEGHLGRDCDQGNNSYSGNSHHERQDSWDTPAPASTTSQNSSSVGADEDWDEPGECSPSKKSTSSTTPKAAASADDDWDAPSDPSTPQIGEKAKTSVAVTDDDDWDTPTPVSVATTASTKHVSGPVDDDWDAITAPNETTMKAATTGIDDWSFDTTPSTSGGYSSQRDNSRGRGGFGGGRGRGRGRGGSQGGPMVCFRCNKEGHMSRECTESGGNNRGGSGRGRVCYNCDEEGHLGRDCPKPKKQNFGSNSNFRSHRQNSWETPESTTNQSSAAADEDWDAPSESSTPTQTQSSASITPKVTASVDDDWDAPSAFSTPQKVEKLKNSVAVTDDDDWDTPTPVSVATTASTKPVSGPVDDDWDAITAPKETSVKPATSGIDDWSFDTTPSTSGYSSQRDSRGRGGFGGGRGSGRGRGGSHGGPMICFRCNKEGHMSRECTESGGNNRGGFGRGRVCYNCDEEGHLGRDCPKPKKQNFGSNSNFRSHRQNSWETPPDSTTNQSSAAADEDWDAPSESSTPTQTQSSASITPKVTASTADDWDAPCASSTPQNVEKLKNSVAVTDDDDWDTPTPVSVATTASTKPVSGPVDDDWDAITAPNETSVKPATSGIDNWSFDIAPSTTGGYSYQRDDTRGRGGFGGGRGRGRGRGGSQSGPMVCFRCNKEGHMSRECTESGGNNRGGFGRGRVCYNCDEEGHLGRDCPKPKKQNFGGNSNFRSHRQNSWETPPESTTNQSSAAADEDWDAPSESPPPTQTQPSPSITPKVTASTDDDWDAPFASSTPQKVEKLENSVAVTEDDNWDIPSPVSVATTASTKPVSGPVDDNCDALTAPKETSEKLATSGIDDWSFDTTPSTSGGYTSQRDNSRGRGGFGGGRGRGRGRGGSQGGPMVCFRCNKEGHMSRECTESSGNNSGGYGRVRICYNCEEEGHLGRDCAKPRKRNFDNGSSRTDRQDSWEGTPVSKMNRRTIITYHDLDAPVPSPSPPLRCSAPAQRTPKVSGSTDDDGNTPSVPSTPSTKIEESKNDDAVADDGVW